MNTSEDSTGLCTTVNIKRIWKKKSLIHNFIKYMYLALYAVKFKLN